MSLREAAQQALEALDEAGQYIDPGDSIHPMVCDAADALQAALEQPEQEPVALCDPAEYDDFQGAVSRNQSASRQI